MAIGTKTPAVRGKRMTLKIVAEDGPVKVWTMNSLNDGEDAELDSKGYLGGRTKLASREHNGWDGDFDLDVAARDWYDLEDKIIQRDIDNLPPFKINLTKIIAFTDGTIAGWTYQEIKAKFRSAAPNREGYIHISGTWKCDNRVKAA